MLRTRVGRSRFVALGAIAVLTLLLTGGTAGAASHLPSRDYHPNAVTTTLTIRADGTVSTAGILSVSGNTYTLLAAYAGSIADERNGSVLDGAGNTVTYTSGTATVMAYAAVNVTLRNLVIVSTQTGIEVLNSSEVTVTNNTVATPGMSFEVLTSTHVMVSNNTAPSTLGFGTSESSDVGVEDNHFSNSTMDGIDASIVTGLTVQGNDLSHAHSVPLNLAYVASVTVRANRLDASVFGFGVVLDYVQQGNVSANNLTDGSGSDPVIVGDSANITLWKNVESPGTTYGYSISVSSGISIVDAVALGAVAAGAYLGQDVGVTLLRVDFSNSGIGVDDEASTAVRVVDSHVGGGATGVYIVDGSGLSIVGSDLTVANNGLYAQFSSGIVVQASNLSRANYPLNLTSGTRNVLVEGSQLDGAQITGAYLNNVSNITLDHSSIRSPAQYGVQSTWTRGLTISSCDLSGTRGQPGGLGVATSGDTEVALVNDSLNWTTSPFTDQFSDGVRIASTDFSNTTNGGMAISLYGDSRVSVTGSDFFNDTGTGIDGSSILNLSVSHSNFEGIQFNGLTLLYVEDLTVTANTFDNAGEIAVYASHIIGLSASDNSMDNDSYAFFLDTGTNEVIARNTALNDRDGGLAANDQNGFVVAGNSFSNDTAPDLTAIELNTATGFSFVGNTFANDGGRALYITGRSTGTIVGNSFPDDNASVDLEGSVNALIYHNDFVRDARWGINNTPTLSWDNGYPSGGNFWSNYTGTDLNNGPGQNLPGADGIGDTPFVLESNNIDHYPLMTSWANHAVLFIESGLPAGTPWAVEFNGSLYTSSSNSLTVASAVGRASFYNYTVPGVLGYEVTPSSGNGTMGLGLVTVNVVFRLPVYPVTFQESGLPIGTGWAVAINGTVVQGANSTLTFDLTNGTYGFSANASHGFSAQSPTGTFSVVGAALTVPLAFYLATYPVTIIEVGLPTGASWNLTLGGFTSRTTTTSVTLQLANGSYPFSVGAPSGFNATPSSSMLTVSGSPVTVYLAFAAMAGSGPGPGPGTGGSGTTSPSPLLWIVIVVLVAAAAVGWFFALWGRRRREPPATGSASSPPSERPTVPPGAH